MVTAGWMVRSWWDHGHLWVDYSLFIFTYFPEENFGEKHFLVLDMSPNIMAPCSTTNQSAVYVKNEVGGLEITADEEIPSKVESRGLKQKITTQLANRSWQQHQNRSNSSVLRCGPMAASASCSFICGTQTVPVFLHCWSLTNEGRQHGPRNAWNYIPHDTMSLPKILESPATPLG
jgi:hypothetical protein